MDIILKDIYNGGHPAPSKKDEDIRLMNTETLSSSKSKFVRMTVTYPSYDRIKNVWYNDGVYRGWLYANDATAEQNSDFSWTVYYKGTVYKVPNQFLPDKVIDISRE